MICKKGILTRSDSKKFVDVDFEVPFGVEELILSLDYSPKHLQDKEANRKLVLSSIKEYENNIGSMNVLLKRYNKYLEQIVELITDRIYPVRNLLNFSVYDPQGKFRGRWDWGKRKVVVSEKISSPGMLSGPIYPGMWRLELEVAAIVTDKCQYEIKIDVKRYNVKPKWIKGHLHVHTYHSDGKNTLDEMVKESRRQGLDFIALTDHNTISGHKDIKKYKDFCVLSGMEFTTLKGHATALGIKEYIDWRTNDNRNMNDIVSEVHRLGGIFAVAHPFVLGGVICAGCKWNYTEEECDYTKVDLLEIWSGSWTELGIPNKLAIRLWDRLLNRGLHIVGISGKDWHDKSNNPKDCGINYILVNEFSENAILSSLSAGRVFLSSGPIIEFKAICGGVTYNMGDTIPFSENQKITFYCLINDEKFLDVLVIKNSGVFLKTQKKQFNFSVFPKKGNWYRIEIYKTKSDRLLAISNPIRISLI